MKKKCKNHGSMTGIRVMTELDPCKIRDDGTHYIRFQNKRPSDIQGMLTVSVGINAFLIDDEKQKTNQVVHTFFNDNGNNYVNNLTTKIIARAADNDTVSTLIKFAEVIENDPNKNEIINCLDVEGEFIV